MFACDVNRHIYACTCTVLKGKNNTHSEGMFRLKECKTQELGVHIKTEGKKNLGIHRNRCLDRKNSQRSTRTHIMHL